MKAYSAIVLGLFALRQSSSFTTPSLLFRVSDHSKSCGELHMVESDPDLLQMLSAINQKIDHADKQLDKKLYEALEPIREEMKLTKEKLDHVDKQLEPIREEMKLIKVKIDGVDKRFDNMDKQFDNMDKRLDGVDEKLTRLDKGTSLLVEEITRKYVARKFGDDFSQSYNIKSIHDIVDLISEADTIALPCGDREAGRKAAEKMINFLNPFFPVFLEAVINQVAKAMDEEAVFNLEAFKVPKQEIRDVQEEVKAATQAATQSTLARWCGTVLGAVNKLSTVQIDGESETDQVAREKMMSKRFKRKLERIHNSLRDGERGLATCEGAGIMMCNALAAAGREVWEGKVSLRDWIQEQCIQEKSIFDFKHEIECDLRPSVKINSGTSWLRVGEIKSNISSFGKAKVQMQEQVLLLELGLWCIFGTEEPMEIVKEGHFFVLEASADH